MKTLQEYGLHHAGFVVKDLEKTIKRFEEVYGIKSGEPYEFRPSRVWSYGTETYDYCLKIAMITMENGSIIEVIQPVSGEGVHKDFIESGKEGLHHICFSVDDYDHWREHFAKQDSRIVFESETEDELNGYRRCFYAEDSNIGMIYEIKENPYFRK